MVCCRKRHRQNLPRCRVFSVSSLRNSRGRQRRAGRAGNLFAPSPAERKKRERERERERQTHLIICIRACMHTLLVVKLRAPSGLPKRCVGWWGTRNKNRRAPTRSFYLTSTHTHARYIGKDIYNTCILTRTHRDKDLRGFLQAACCACAGQRSGREKPWGHEAEAYLGQLGIWMVAVVSHLMELVVLAMAASGVRRLWCDSCWCRCRCRCCLLSAFVLSMIAICVLNLDVLCVCSLNLVFSSSSCIISCVFPLILLFQYNVFALLLLLLLSLRF